MNSILDIPEIRALDGPASLIRIPSQMDVPVTDRLMRLVDTPEFQRLSRISQLGMVSFVYPAANHNRFEHSLGVYRNSLLFLRQFAHQDRFAKIVSPRDATLLILAALLHDIGHWPYCHPIEDIQITGLPTHEHFAKRYLSSESVARCLKEDWSVEPHEVIGIINKSRVTQAQALMSSILSGPIDIDKMDYLYRDSLHAGVPYGQNFDSLRLIRSLCLNDQGDRLAITNKGRTAAELMVFARYVMFSEVYWHPAVRSGTAMFQRAFYLWHQQHHDDPCFDEAITELFASSEAEMIGQMKRDCSGTPAADLLDRLFGSTRRLFKCVANYSCDENERIYRMIAQQPYAWLRECSDRLAALVGKELGRVVSDNDVLIDAPPVGLEVQCDIDVFYPDTRSYRKLGEVSPVVKTLACQQFDDFVKQVRIFVCPELAPDVAGIDLSSLLRRAIKNQ